MVVPGIDDATQTIPHIVSELRQLWDARGAADLSLLREQLRAWDNENGEYSDYELAGREFWEWLTKETVDYQEWKQGFKPERI